MPLDQAANETYGLSFKLRAHETKAKMTRASAALLPNTKAMWTIVPPWPNGQGVGLLIRRLRFRAPQGVYLKQVRVISRPGCKRFCICVYFVWARVRSMQIRYILAG